MVDTVRFMFSACLNQKFPSGWTVTHNKKTNAILRVLHDDSGLKVEPRKDGGVFVEVSLPRLLFGTNARLIFNNAQLQKAFDAAKQLALAVAKPLYPRQVIFQRIDLTWQLLGDIEKVIAALHFFKYPGIRKLPINYHGETLLWKSVGFSLQFYDKERQMNKRRREPGKVLRIEVRLLPKGIEKFFPSAAHSQTLQFSVCYAVYRRMVLKFVSGFSQNSISTRSLYHYAVKNRWEVEGEPAIEFWLRRFEPKKARPKKRRELMNEILRSYHLDLRKHFPPKHPCPVFHLDKFDISLPLSRFRTFICSVQRLQQKNATHTTI